jgi:hypothetical protein
MLATLPVRAAFLKIGDLTEGNPTISQVGFDTFQVDYIAPENVGFSGTWSALTTVGGGFAFLVEPNDPTKISDILTLSWGLGSFSGTFQSFEQGVPIAYWNPVNPIVETGTFQTISVLEADQWYLSGGMNGGSIPFGVAVASDVPVPEPTTVIAGALLLLPFGASTIRILRKKIAA